MRCLTSLLCLLGLILVSGCTRQLFVSEADYDRAAVLPPRLETEPIGPLPLAQIREAPPNVLDPDRPARLLSLHQAIAISLDNGTTSSSGGPGTGIPNDNLVVFTGSNLASQSDRLRVLAQLPAQAAANIEQSLSRFDPKWTTSILNTSTNELTQGNGNTTNGNSAQFQTSIMKAFASGGIVSSTFETDYRTLSTPFPETPALPNPLYTTKLTFGYEQPLWRDFGVEINQLLNRVAPFYGTAFPTFAQTAFGNQLNVLNQGSSLAGGGTVFTEGILIARIRYDSQRADFERNVDNMVLNVEAAYWKLYQAYGTLYSYEELLRLVHKGWMTYKSRYDAGIKDGGSLKDYAPILAKYHELRGDRIAALGAVLDAERNLRGIMGLRVEDGTRLVPITPPTQAYYQPNWSAAIKDALSLRPELVLARENVRLAQLNLINQKNFLKPDLRFIAQYSPVGFGTSLAGTGQMVNGGQFTPFPAITSNAFSSLASGQFNDWTAGLVLNIPLGFRLEQAAVRQSRLSLVQAYELLKDQEERAERQLCQQYQKVSEWYTRIEAATQETKAYSDALNAYIQEINVGTGVASPSLIIILNQLQPALLKQFEAIASYNTTLAFFEYTKGTLLNYDNIAISEGPLPDCVQVQALERLRQATHALPILSHPGPINGKVDPVSQPSVAISDSKSLPPSNLPLLTPSSAARSASSDAWKAAGDTPYAPPQMQPQSGPAYGPVPSAYNGVPSATNWSQQYPDPAQMTVPQPISPLSAPVETR